MKQTLTVLLALLLSAFATNSSQVSALSISSSRDCDANAVIMCGVSSTSELQSKYYQTPSVQTIFHNFGITHNDINAMGNTAVVGNVTQGGRVVVNGQTVANNALTVGRQNMSGSSAQTHNGVTYYTRTPSVSFQTSSLPAFVVLNKDGSFNFAVIASCGNQRKINMKTKLKMKIIPCLYTPNHLRLRCP
jgi:hypothetical protein